MNCAAERFSDDPMQFDRNRDGKLTASELAVRYANRRVEEQDRQAARGGGDQRSRGGWTPGNGWTRGDSSDDKKEEEKSRFGDVKSYRMSSAEEKANSVKGLPDFFARSDADADGQVLMSEFSSTWNSETLNEFLKWDLNSDGIITARECLAALEGGARVSGSTSSSSTASSSSSAEDSKSSGSSAAAGGGGTPDALTMEWAQRQIAKYDKNNDNQLTAKEWESMFVDPSGADVNGDGIITVEEYAAFRAKGTSKKN